MLGKEEGLQFASLLQPVKASTHKLERRVVLKKCSTKFAGKILICSRRYPVPNILYTVYIYIYILSQIEFSHEMVYYGQSLNYYVVRFGLRLL